jgi:multidrug efflux pump subunit AcrB
VTARLSGQPDMLLADWAAVHRRSILFLLLIAAAGGVLAGLNLPIALFPNVAFPRVEVDLNAGERPANVMVVQVTRPAEEAVRSIAGVTSVRSTTSRGSAELSVTFFWGTDMDRALGQVEAVIARIVPDLPQGSSFTARKMNPTVFPVAAYSLFSNTAGPIELRDIAQYELLPLLSAVPGVARVNVEGGDVPEFRVTARPALLASYGVTMQDVTSALARENVLKVVGRVEDRHELLLAVAQTRLLTPAAIGGTVIRSNPDGTVRLSDVAQVTT